MEKSYELSVIVITYNSDLNRILQTVKSALNQNNIDLEIIVSDDGSKNNFFLQIEEYLQNNQFTEYIMLPHTQNQGTVKNVIDAVKIAHGEYIKVIAAGDFFYNDDTLRNWIDFLKKSDAKWSFSLAEFYSMDESLENMEVLDFPKNPKAYMQNDELLQRRSYCIQENVGHGACMISEKKVMIDYLSYIDGEIKYAEDVIWRLMMFKGNVGRYYQHKTVYYEYGTGVSNSKSLKWIKKMVSDTNSIKKVISKICDPNDKIQVKLKNEIQKAQSLIILKKIIAKATQSFIPQNNRSKAKIKFITYDNMGGE